MRGPGRAGASWALALCVLAQAFAADIAAAQAPVTEPAASPFTLNLLAPRDAETTSREVVHILGRTVPGAQVRVGGEPVTVFSSGVFARDRVPLALGSNRIVVTATSAEGQVLERTLNIERVPPPVPVEWPADRLYIDGSRLLPASTVRVAPGEPLEVQVRATPGQQVQARLPGQPWQALTERADRPGHYRALLAFAGSDDIEPAPVQVRVTARALPRGTGARSPGSITALTPGSAGEWRNDAERLYLTGPEGANLLHGLHEVRLGGPYLAELPPGVLLNVNARRGTHLRVRLAPDVMAWVDEAEVQALAPGTPAPHAAFTTLAVAGAEGGDVVTIPLDARVPFAVNAVSGSDGRMHLEVDIFNSHHASTWISHRASTRVVREVTAEQPGPERVRVRITPHAARLWGWRVERTDTALRVLLRAAPVLKAAAALPLEGLRVALEPGHGSADNLGAVGATRVPEKDINRLTVQALKTELEAAGAQVVVVREGDENPPLRERARRVTESQAHLFVSVHANAAGTEGGYLRTQGTATFYKHTTGRDLAAAVQRRMLEQTALEDFGLVGNFNYTPLRRVTWMPGVLVEQAFMSHPGDEARLLEPAFRATIARAVRMGLEDFLRLPAGPLNPK